MPEGYYWCSAPDGTTFVALYQGGGWHVPGVGGAIEVDIRADVLCPVVRPEVQAQHTVQRLVNSTRLH